MENIKEYLLSITAAAIICSVVNSLPIGNGPTKRILKVITGLFMSVTLISPIMQFDFTAIPDYFTDVSLTAEQLTAEGQEYSTDAMSHIIKQKMESYILDEANRVGADMDVEVKVTESYPPEPYQVIVRGSISPYNKKSLMEYIAKNLGIPQESQIWI